MKSITKIITILSLCIGIILTGCNTTTSNTNSNTDYEIYNSSDVNTDYEIYNSSNVNISKDNKKNLYDIEYTDAPYVTINNNKPDFTEEDKKSTTAFETYSDLDDLNRCGVAYANICKEIMPTEERGRIGMVKPSGWHTVKYDCVNGKYLYNRCHLIGYQLAGENANEKNLITGTRYLNMDGMLPFENIITDYVKETNNHVLYRVTPVFKNNNLVASGVQMEGYSVEDKGKGICFNIYCFNVQPNIVIDYKTGESHYGTNNIETNKNDTNNNNTNNTDKNNTDKNNTATYIINTNTKKFHKPSCDSAKRTKAKNKKEIKTSRQELIEKGYEPCKICNP